MKSDLERFSDDYERAKSAFLDAVRAQAGRAQLASAARKVAVTAGRFNSEAYRAHRSRTEGAWMPLDQLTERTEVLAELWLDPAAAYEA